MPAPSPQGAAIALYHRTNIIFNTRLEWGQTEQKTPRGPSQQDRLTTAGLGTLTATHACLQLFCLDSQSRLHCLFGWWVGFRKQTVQIQPGRGPRCAARSWVNQERRADAEPLRSLPESGGNIHAQDLNEVTTLQTGTEASEPACSTSHSQQASSACLHHRLRARPSPFTIEPTLYSTQD